MGGSNRAFEPGSLQVSAPYFIAGRTGVLGTGLAAGDPVARLVHLGMVPGVPPAAPGVVVPTPIQISQIRLKLSATALPTLVHSFEILKGTGAQADTGGTLHLPQRRKTSGYPTIAATETSLYTATTGAISGGSFTPLEAAAPLDVVAMGTQGVGVTIWKPFDTVPLQLEAGEALEVRLLQDDATATGILLVAFDFLR